MVNTRLSAQDLTQDHFGLTDVSPLSDANSAQVASVCDTYDSASDNGSISSSLSSSESRLPLKRKADARSISTKCTLQVSCSLLPGRQSRVLFPSFCFLCRPRYLVIARPSHHQLSARMHASVDYWDRTEECKRRKLDHMDKLDSDRRFDSREDFILSTVLAGCETLMEPNKFPYDCPVGIHHWTLWSRIPLDEERIEFLVENH